MGSEIEIPRSQTQYPHQYLRTSLITLMRMNGEHDEKIEHNDVLLPNIRRNNGRYLPRETRFPMDKFKMMLRRGKEECHGDKQLFLNKIREATYKIWGITKMDDVKKHLSPNKKDYTYHLLNLVFLVVSLVGVFSFIKLKN